MSKENNGLTSLQLKEEELNKSELYKLNCQLTRFYESGGMIMDLEEDIAVDSADKSQAVA